MALGAAGEVLVKLEAMNHHQCVSFCNRLTTSQRLSQLELSHIFGDKINPARSCKLAMPQKTQYFSIFPTRTSHLPSTGYLTGIHLCYTALLITKSLSELMSLVTAINIISTFRPFTALLPHGMAVAGSSDQGQRMKQDSWMSKKD